MSAPPKDPDNGPKDATPVTQAQNRALLDALQGEYGVRDQFLGVPVVLGKGGAEKVVEIELTADEKTALMKSAEPRGLPLAGSMSTAVAQLEMLAHRHLNVLQHGERGEQRAVLEQNAPAPLDVEAVLWRERLGVLSE